MLSQTIFEVQNVSNQVGIGANELSSAAQALANGASKQAASLEEIASSMDEVRAYHFPQADELYDLTDFSAVVRETSRDSQYFLCLEVESLFDRSWNVRGMENFMVDLLANQEIAHYILAENARFFFERTYEEDEPIPNFNDRSRESIEANFALENTFFLYHPLSIRDSSKQIYVEKKGEGAEGVIRVCFESPCFRDE